MTQQPYKWMKLNDNEIFIEIRVIPNSSKNFHTFEEEFLKIKLTAPAVDNKANKSLIEYMAKLLKVPKTSIEILSGNTSKNKKLKISGEAKDILKKLFL